MKKLILFLLALIAISAIVVSCQGSEVAIEGGYNDSVGVIPTSNTPTKNNVTEKVTTDTEVAVESDAPDGGYEVDGDPDDEGAVMIGSLSGSWGRLMNGAISAGKGNNTINNRYSCLHFDPIGSFVTMEWYTNAKKFKALGYYSTEVVNGQTLVRWEITSFSEPLGYKGPEEKVLGHHRGYLKEKANKYRQIVCQGAPVVYTEDVQWNWEAGCYMDSEGYVMGSGGATKHLPELYVGHDGGGWKVEDYASLAKQVSVLIYEQPIEKNKQRATAWLKSKGITEKDFRIYFYSPAYIDGHIGP